MTMRGAILSLLFICFFVPRSFAQGDDATLDETVSWIEGKLNYYDYDKIVPHSISVKFDKATKVLKFTTIFREKEGNPRQYVVRYIPLKLINPNNIYIEENEEGYHWVNFSSNNNKNVIKWESWFVNEGADKKTILMENNFQFRIPPSENLKNPDLAVRLKKAMIHLIKLCGGTGEKF
jgi:hypothetical protein